MGTAIAFLSGKGGSGKTTLALSIADLLCICKVKTLLVDCDLSTNGATYFYETQLVNRNRNEELEVNSFSRLLNGSFCSDNARVLEIGSNLDFIPSISSISGQHLMDEVIWHAPAAEKRLQSFVEWAKKSYEVILFDCQAGYTELLSVLLPLMDADLFVLEADSISASAMRSLHLKIGSSLGRAQLYQVFNKATKEEFDIYSKIVGTFFTNIGTLLFDWKIRQAFSRSQVPDLEHTGAQYGYDLCEICKIIFQGSTIQERLERFSIQSRYRQLEEKRWQIEDKMDKVRFKPKYLLLPIMFLCCAFIIILFLLMTKNFFLEMKYISFVVLVEIVATISSVIKTSDSFFESRVERRKYERELKNLSWEFEKLKFHTKQFEKNTQD